MHSFIFFQNSPDCCNVCDVENQSPLHVACKLGHYDIVKCLMEWPYPESLKPSQYTDRDQTCYKMAVHVNALNNEKRTALYLACENGFVDIVKYLLNFNVEGTRLDGSISGSMQSQCSKVVSNIQVYPVRLFKDFGNDENGTVSYDSSGSDSVINLSTSCLYVAVKNSFHDVVELLLKAGVKSSILTKVGDVEYSAILLTALENNDLLMIDKLFLHKVEDVNSHVLKKAIQEKPDFIHHFLKYKSSLDQHYSINKVAMKKEYASNFLIADEDGRSISVDTLNPERFPTNPVYVRWQNLHYLSVVKETWLTCVGNHNNPRMSNVNRRVPLFAITRVDVSNNSITMLPASLLQLPSLCVLVAAQNKIREFPEEDKFSLDCECLEDIDLSHNKLTALPSYLFTDLPSLKSLNASQNKIRELPSSLWHNESMKTLDLSDNSLETLPKPGVWVRKSSEANLDDASPDRRLSILSNNVAEQEVAGNTYANLYDVRKINHWSPKLISDEEVKAAETKKGLKTLKLSKNHLTEFPDFLSCCAPQLETLELSKNKFTSLGLLASYPKLLKNLDLSHNRILDMVDWIRKLAHGQLDETYCEHKL